MAEKMAERIAEILKEPNFQTARESTDTFVDRWMGNSGIFWWILLWNDGLIA